MDIDNRKQWDYEMDWLDFGEWCDIHKIWYLGGTIGMCPDCEDGKPPVKEKNDG